MFLVLFGYYVKEITINIGKLCGNLYKMPT
jgi:hypothetical protein